MALSQDWHSSKPVLRLSRIATRSTTSSAETVIRHIEIHGGVNNWYVDVQDPPKSFRLDIGYLAPGGKFFVLARSNIVTTPRFGATDNIDENWNAIADDFEKVYAMSGGFTADGASGELKELFEERLRRPMTAPVIGTNGASIPVLDPRAKEFTFSVDAEMIFYGTTQPNAKVTLKGDPVKVRPDGTFTVRYSMPNRRQVIPVVASSADGMEQRTIVLAVERNTKFMEPILRDRT